MSHLNQPNIERKSCVWTTKYKRLLEMCIVQQVEMKSAFTFHPIKLLLSTTVKSAKPAATFWKIVFRAKTRQLCCLEVMVRVAITEKNHLCFRRNFSANHNQAHPNLNQKDQKSFPLWHNRVDTPLADTANQNFIYILFFLLSIYIKATWLFQSPTTVMSGLSKLDQIQWLWL